MVKRFTELMKNINFDLRLAECIVCLVGTISSFLSYATDPLPWPIHGWFVISLTFVVTYILDQLHYGLEILLIAIYHVLMMALIPPWSFSIKFLCLLITGLLTLVDLIVLISNRNE